MATVVNFIDTTLQSAPSRTVNLPSAQILLTPSAPAFHVTTGGANSPASITFASTLIALEGTISFTCTGGTLTNVTATSADLTYANMSGASATVTASITVNGATFSAPCTISKVLDGATGATGPTGSTGSTGSTGASGTQVAPVTLYQWSTSTPSAPTGTSTLTWATGANSAYSAADGWAVAAPTNPGTPGIKLFVATVAVSAAATVTTSTVSYSGAAVSAWSQNGATGTSGIQSGAAIVYQWAATIPSGPAGSATYTWSSGAFGAAPTGWALNPGTSPSAGYTLWQARVGVTDSAANTTTAFNWTSAAITSVGYAGQTGSSYVAAYCDSATATTTTTPAATTGSSSVPAVNDGGLTGTWQKTVPTGLASGHYMWQSDGIYNPATNQVSWSIPYWSYAKFGSLSAITANLGQITAGSIDIGTGATSWHVDTSGNTWAGNASYASAPYRVSNAGAAVFTNVTIMTGASTIIDASGLKTGYEAPGTKNNRDSVITEPGGGVRLSSTGVENGALKIRLPQTWTSTMLKFTVEIFEYVAGYTCTLEIAGYNSDDGAGTGHWSNITARVLGGSNVEYPVYYGHDGVKCCIWVGVQTESWAFPQVRIRDVFVGFNNFTEAMWGSGWQLSFDVATATGVTGSVLDTLPGADWAKVPNRSGKPADNATVGAPAGTPVGSTSATTVESGAANGATALAAVNDATTGLAARLRNNAANVLSGGAGIAVGSLTWNSSGVRTGGYGVGLTSYGLVGYNSSGALTISINASTGAVAVSADISGSTGTFGDVIIGTSLRCGQTAYDTGTGFWHGLVSGTPKLSIGIAGGSSFKWDGTNVILANASVVSATISSPTITAPILPSITGGALTDIVSSGGGTSRSLGTKTVSGSGGRAPYTYAWSLDIGNPGVKITGGASTVTVSLLASVAVAPDSCDAILTCAVTDANGQTGFSRCSIVASFN